MSVAEPVAIPASAQSRSGVRLAWALWLTTVGLAAAGLALLAVAGFQPIPDSWGFPGFTALFALSFGSVGAVVIARRPGNRVGQVLLAVGLVSGFQTFYTEYAKVGLMTAPGSLPFAIVGAWLIAWAWVPFVLLAGPILLSIFPDGRLVSPRWRLPIQFSAIAATALMVVSAFERGPLNNFRTVDNPVGIIPVALAQSLFAPLALAMSLSMLGPAASLVVRFRRADQDRRQQLKWFAVAGIVFALVAPFGFIAGRPGEIGPVLFILAFCTLPIAAGIAVLRYGLYEIDTIINRAIVYGLLTAVIAGLYTASIGLMQRVSHAVTGGDSEATIVVTTIVIVAAFTPIKSRLQMLVDKRFKEAVDPRVRLQAFNAMLEQRLWPLDRRLALQRFVELVVSALALPGGQADFERDQVRLIARSGEPVPTDGVDRWSTWAASGTSRVTLTLAVRRSVSGRDGDAVTEALAALVQQLDLA
jgi:hypothetical protein